MLRRERPGRGVLDALESLCRWEGDESWLEASSSQMGGWQGELDIAQSVQLRRGLQEMLIPQYSHLPSRPPTKNHCRQQV